MDLQSCSCPGYLSGATVLSRREVITVAAVSSRLPRRESVDVCFTIDLVHRKTKFTVVHTSCVVYLYMCVGACVCACIYLVNRRVHIYIPRTVSLYNSAYLVKIIKISHHVRWIA